jgi:hypothetical protein
VPTNFPIPKPETIRQLIADLLGREVSVVAGDPLALDADTTAVVADYVGDNGQTAAVCLTDLRLSNALGAALTMAPAQQVDESVKQGVVDAQNLENLTEVVKVMARWFNTPECEHTKWHEVHTLPGELPEPAAALVASPAARRDYDVSVDEYGSGKFSILVA